MLSFNDENFLAKILRCNSKQIGHSPWKAGERSPPRKKFEAHPEKGTPSSPFNLNFTNG